MPVYRKKPVAIEARQVGGFTHSTLLKWIESEGGDARYNTVKNSIDIETLEGVMSAQLGDFIIKGVQGEFYPCKPDIFAATYEAVGEG